MENSPLLWALIILVFILILLRIFGRNLPDKINFQNISKKWKYIGGGALAVIVLSLVGGSFLMSDDDVFRYEEPKTPSTDDFFNDLEEIVKSNSGEIKSIKQTVCKARDSAGVILCEKRIRDYGGYWSETRTFDKNGNLIEHEVISSEKSRSVYNKEGKESKRIFINIGLADSILYEYGDELETEIRYKNGSIVGTTKRKYNSDNLIEDISVYGENGSLKHRTTYDYFNNAKKRVKEYVSGQLNNQKILTFDEKGRCIEFLTEYYDEGQKVREEKNIYEYDFDGKIIGKQRFIDNNQLVSKMTCIYESGRLIGEENKVFKREGSLSVITKSFIEFNKRGDVFSKVDSTFGEYGNLSGYSANEYTYKYHPEHEDIWVEMFHRFQGQIAHRISREIEYY